MAYIYIAKYIIYHLFVIYMQLLKYNLYNVIHFRIFYILVKNNLMQNLKNILNYWYTACLYTGCYSDQIRILGLKYSLFLIVRTSKPDKLWE